MSFYVEFRPKVLKNIKHLPKKELLKIKEKIDSLAHNLPDPNTTKMKGNNSFHKVRVGNYRIIYEIHDDKLVILIVKIGHRKDIYKNL
jgi:mRNA interferase RelE/StbE